MAGTFDTLEVNGYNLKRMCQKESMVLLLLTYKYRRLLTCHMRLHKLCINFEPYYWPSVDHDRFLLDTKRLGLKLPIFPQITDIQLN